MNIIAGLTGITYYPVLTLEGDTFMHLYVGDTYEEPGFSAILNGEDVTDQVVVSAPDDMTAESGLYTITYSITNADGFSAKSTRSIFVTINGDKVEGVYWSKPDCYLDYDGAQYLYKGSYKILVFKSGDEYFCDDLLGGWYSQRAGYGSNYSLNGYLTIENGNVSLVDSLVPAWGDSANYMYDGEFDEDTGTLSWVVGYYAYDFYVTLVKEE